MGKTADLAMVQKTIIDTLHKEGESQRVIAEGVLYQSISNAKLTRRTKFGRKMCTSNSDDRKLENTVKQSRFKTLGRASQGVNWRWSQCIKSHHAQASSGKGLPSHSWIRNIVRSILPGLRRKRTGLLLSGPKSSFPIKVHFAFHLEIKVWRKSGEVKNPSCLKSSVKFPQSVMIWGCRDICWCWSTVFYQVWSQCSHLPGDFRALYVSICWQALWRCWFLFQQDFSTCPHCQNHFQVLCWSWYYCAWLASQHAWPEPHLESIGYFQEKDEKQSIQ